ncbi:MAG: ATP-binding protein, partial [Rubripirellula sp.]
VENVLRNAVRYAKRDVLLELAKGEGEAAVVVVHDDGPGIPEDMRQQVLQHPLQQS